MLSINKKKYLKSLDIKKYRQIEKKTFVEGFRIINEALKAGLRFEQIWINEKYNNDSSNILLFIQKLKKESIIFSFESDKDIKSVCNTKNSQGVIGLFSTKNLYNENVENFSNKIIILDQISDPGNLGSIIRTCAWFGIESILLSESSSDIFNPKCLRSAMGGHFYIKDCIYLSNYKIIEFIKSKKYHLYCATMDGASIYNIKPPKKWAMILGSEAHGISSDLLFGENITIPKCGKIDSLNVSIASGIIIDYLNRASS